METYMNRNKTKYLSFNKNDSDLLLDGGSKENCRCDSDKYVSVPYNTIYYNRKLYAVESVA